MNKTAETMSKKKRKKIEFDPVHSQVVDVNYHNYTMLVAIANYIANPDIIARARFYLDPDVGDDEKRHVMSGEGSFMMAILRGNFMRAYQQGSRDSQDALVQGLVNREINMWE